MSMIDALYELEAQTFRDSPVHRLDARVKIVAMFAGVIAMAAFPYTTAVYLLGLLFAAYIATIWITARLPLWAFGARLIAVLPFGLFIIIIQIFFPNPHYPVSHPLVTFPPGITVFAESVEFASILLVKFLVCVSFVLLLSSATRMTDLLNGAAHLGMPGEFTLVIGLMIRYLFVFGGMYRRIRRSLASRCFDPFDRRLSYRYRLRQLGYTVGMMFLRSYEQGERTYKAMRCRGYGTDSHRRVASRPLRHPDWIFLGTSMAFVVAAPVAVWLLS